MKGLQFQQDRSTVQESATRADIACFIGFARFRGVDIPEHILEWLRRREWLSYPGFSSNFFRESALNLLDIPVPIESWDEFNNLFEWQNREINTDVTSATYLGSAVNAFFAQGGRKCYVVVCGEPFSYSLAREERLSTVSLLLPGYPSLVNSNRNNRNSWHGIGHLLGLNDVSFVSIPDLSDIFRSDLTDIDTTETIPLDTVEQFVECSDEQVTAQTDTALSGIAAPVLSQQHFQDWQQAVNLAVQFISNFKRDTQLLLSFPLLQEPFAENLSTTIDSRFLQLNYPWVKTPFSSQLPQNVEPGEGHIIGLLARNALQRGTYRSSVALKQNYIYDIEPNLSLSEMLQQSTLTMSSHLLEDRISLWQRDFVGIKLRSDVTASVNTHYRYASVTRTFSLLIKIAHTFGDDLLFESNGENLWRSIKAKFYSILRSLYQLGALDGKTELDAFSVRCDRSTMTQNDIDSGRVIVELSVNIAASIETIIISMSTRQSGEVLSGEVISGEVPSGEVPSSGVLSSETQFESSGVLGAGL